MNKVIRRTKRLLFLLPLFLVAISSFAQRSGQGLISGRILDEDGATVAHARITLKGTAYRGRVNDEGVYHVNAPAGAYTMRVEAMGYKPMEKKIKLETDSRTKLNITLTERGGKFGEALVTAKSVDRINTSAYNAVALDAKSLHNSTLNLSDAIGRMPGMKLRETGGVGSDMQLMLDGFTGKHVRIFIDGVPQEGVGSSFGLNNIPINFAERIEVYRGVVPVEFGTDALGGVVNIVTGKTKRQWWLDASYSYGSFNTHKSYVNFGQNLKNGLFYELNAFQNYSDNDYYINTRVKEFFDTNNDGVFDISKFTKDEKRVKRFNDTYHNEAVVGKFGVQGKKWADRLLFSLTYSHMYKEIQNGVKQEIVFGEKHRRGFSVIPALEYLDRSFLVRGLDLRLTANYNRNVMENIDTASYEYNWYGERKPKGSRGEQSYQNNEQRSDNWNATLTSNYRFGRIHRLTLSNVFSSYRRTTRSYIDATNKLTDYTIPKLTRKNITGLSYQISPSRQFNGTAFVKYYHQYNKGPVSNSTDGIGSWFELDRTTSTLGYGAALTYFPLKGLQAKFSYEKAVRLPSTDELFGDEDLEAGRANLKAERSDNFNLSVNYSRTLRHRHGLYVEGGLILRNTKDFIRRGLDRSGLMEYGIYENFGKVQTKGFNLSARYDYRRIASLGATYNQMDARDDERFLAGNTQQQNLHYRDRIPNQPYRFANFDASLTWPDLGKKGNDLTLAYNSYWQNEFPLYWESIGSSDSKMKVPDQFSHNLTLSYTLCRGRFNLSLECHNLTDAKLYDNYSLQKAGRAFYGKLRVNLGK